MKKVGAVLAAVLIVGAFGASGVFAGDGGGSEEARERAIAGAFAKRAQDAEAGISAVKRGPRGPRGPRGAKGAQGPQGAQGTIGTIVAVASPGTFLCGWESGACSVGSAVATCPPGTKVISGGHAGAGVRAFISAPEGNGWFIGATNENYLATTVKAIAMCGS